MKTCTNGNYPFIGDGTTTSNECKTCTPGCTKCTAAGLTYCSACGNDGGGVPHYLAVNSTTCGTGCPTGQFIETVGSFVCVACDISCQDCTVNATNCGTCNSGYSQKADNTCVSSCPAAFYSDGTDCLGCDPGCATCYGSALTQCYTCKNNGTHNHFKEIGVNTCVTTCAAGEFENVSAFACQVCDFRCT